jgi:hypothetical protein
MSGIMLEAFEEALKEVQVPMHWHRWQKHRRHPVVIFTVNGVSVQLKPNEELKMATKVSVGHTIALAIAYLDQNGNPFIPTPAPDAPPAWTQSNAAAETLTVAPDALSASTSAIAAGTDTISLTLAVGGVSFSATLAVEVDAASPVLTSIQIVPTVS